MLKSMRALFAQDWANVEAGLYPVPFDWQARHAPRARERAIPGRHSQGGGRQKRRGHSDVGAKGEGLPRYYRQNFHFQTDGYLSEHSAQLYDFQVEALFGGTADAMRRRAYVPIARSLEGRDPARATLLDIGAGTGQFLGFVKSVQPQLKTIALDLSEPYLAKARRVLKRGAPHEFMEAAAEAMPLQGQEHRHRRQHLPVPRIAAEGARSRGEGDCARVEARRNFRAGGHDPVWRCAGFRRPASTSSRELLHEPYYSSFAKSDLERCSEKSGWNGWNGILLI